MFLILSSLRLQYEVSDDSPVPEICKESKPAVTLTLTCPSSRHLVGCAENLNSFYFTIEKKCLIFFIASFSQGSAPRMIAESHCRYEVEWVTEYACHRDYLESHNCKMTNEQHDISIDLTPLTLSCE